MTHHRPFIMDSEMPTELHRPNRTLSHVATECYDSGFIPDPPKHKLERQLIGRLTSWAQEALRP